MNGQVMHQQHHQQHPSIPVAEDDNNHDPPSSSHESSSKRRRHIGYITPRTIPPSFTSVTGSLVGSAPPGVLSSMGNSGQLRRNLSFSRIDPYVSYAQTPSLQHHYYASSSSSSGNNGSDANINNNNNNGGSGDGMDTMMDGSNGEQRVRSMSF